MSQRARPRQPSQPAGAADDPAGAGDLQQSAPNWLPPSGGAPVQRLRNSRAFGGWILLGPDGTIELIPGRGSQL
jgi:hypothetical protein